MGLERELKYQLTKQDYLKLRQILKNRPHHSEKQKNFYFDNKERSLQRRKIGLRIRFCPNKKPVLTVKFSAKRGKGPSHYKIRHEHESLLTLSQAQKLVQNRMELTQLSIRPVRLLRTEIGAQPLSRLKRFGKIVTLRTRYRLAQNLCLELDRFTIQRRTLYELEVETPLPQKTDKKIRQLLKDHTIRCRPLEQSKLSRLLKISPLRKRRK